MKKQKKLTETEKGLVSWLLLLTLMIIALVIWRIPTLEEQAPLKEGHWEEECEEGYEEVEFVHGLEIQPAKNGRCPEGHRPYAIDYIGGGRSLFWACQDKMTGDVLMKELKTIDEVCKSEPKKYWVKDHE